MEGDAPLEQHASLDHAQPRLELGGLTLVVTSLHADRRKQRRCERIAAVLERERLPHQVAPAAAPHPTPTPHTLPLPLPLPLKPQLYPYP